jgi:hypothetical protein
MLNLQNNLDHEIDFRLGEIATLKKLLKSKKLNQGESVILTKYSVASIYSIWEGFVLKSFEYYVEEINNLHLRTNEIHINILTHTLDCKVTLGNERKEFATKCKLVDQMFEYASNESVVITKEVPTNANVNFKVINNIFACFNFSRRLNKRYESKLNFFLKVRNDVAHGIFSIVVDETNIQEFCSLVINLMSEVALIILSEYQERSYLKINECT